MELGHAYSVLVVSASAKFTESVRGLLPERFYWPVAVLTDAAGARRELLEKDSIYQEIYASQMKGEED